MYQSTRTTTTASSISLNAKILLLLLRQKIETEIHLLKTHTCINYLSYYVTTYYKYNFQFETETI